MLAASAMETKLPLTLAEFLGVPDPVTKVDPSGIDYTSKLPVAAFCKQVLASPEYRMSLVRRITLDELPPAIEQLLYYYAEGKPVEKVEVKDTSDPLENLTIDQLEERAMKLLNVARQLRVEEEPQAAERKGSVH